MTLTASRPLATPAPTEMPQAAARTWPRWRARGISAVLMLTSTGLLAWTHVVGLAGSPGFADDEGTYAAQAWAVLTEHRLAPYTYWYDHPPAGWLQLAGWLGITGGLHHGPAVVAARWFAVVSAVVTSLLLWVLARRVGIGRFGATLSILALAFSPLAVSYQRLAYLDNFATPWLVASFVLVLSPRRRLWAAAAGGACFAVAILTKETTLLFTPALAVAIALHADRRTRAFAGTAVAGVAVLLVAIYPLYAALKGELLPGAGHVSLLDALRFQLWSRPSTGSPLAHGSLSRHLVDGWLATDSVLPIAGLVTSVVTLWWWRTRFIGVAVLLPTLMALRPGYLPQPYVIALLPFLALAVGAVADRALGARWSTPRRALALLPRLAATAALVAAVVVVAPTWQRADAYQLHTDDNASTVAAERWVGAHVPHRARIIVDDSVWVDLVRRGFNPNLGVIWMYKLDYATNLDPSVRRSLPDGWRDCDFILVTPVVRSAGTNTPGGMVEIRDAIAHGTTVRTFGTGPNRVTLLALHPPRSSR